MVQKIELSCVFSSLQIIDNGKDSHCYKIFPVSENSRISLKLRIALFTRKLLMESYSMLRRYEKKRETEKGPKKNQKCKIISLAKSLKLYYLPLKTSKQKAFLSFD